MPHPVALAEAYAYAVKMRGLLLGLAALALGGGCAGSRSAPERSPSAISFPSPGLTPVFFRESQMPPGGRASEQSRCIETEIEHRDLNSYGDPKGTIYPEGTPVGVKSTSDRYRYILSRNPGIGTSCTKAIGEPDL